MENRKGQREGNVSMVGIEALRDRKLRVAIYARYPRCIADEMDKSPLYRLEFARKEIEANPNWTYAGTYLDDGMVDPYPCPESRIQDLLTDCRDGQIDLILVRSIDRLARKPGRFFDIVDELSCLKPPVGLYFETENLFTLDESGNICEFVKMLMTVEGEMEQKAKKPKYVVNKRLLEWQMRNQEVERYLGLQTGNEQKSD